jgi:4-hydroxy-tetrahydrodipicolinate synthase
MTTIGQSIARLTGYVSALPTPFRYGQIDDDAFEALCRWHIGEGIDGLLVCSIAGEAPTLSPAEQAHVIGRAVEIAQRRVPVIAGVGSSATTQGIDLARAAERAGADALLVVVPCYNCPSQEGLYRHFRAIHDAVRIPILLHDAPARTGCGLADETLARLAGLGRVLGLADATGDLSRPARLRAMLGARFRLLTGDDTTAPGFFARGGDGCISAVANVAPRLCVALHAAWLAEDFQTAESLALSVATLSRALSLESDPVPVKHALALMGLMSAAVRPPLCEAGEATRREVAACLRDLAIQGLPEPVRWRDLKPRLAPVA